MRALVLAALFLLTACKHHDEVTIDGTGDIHVVSSIVITGPDYPEFLYAWHLKGLQEAGWTIKDEKLRNGPDVYEYKLDMSANLKTLKSGGGWHIEALEPELYRVSFKILTLPATSKLTPEEWSININRRWLINDAEVRNEAGTLVTNIPRVESGTSYTISLSNNVVTDSIGKAVLGIIKWLFGDS